MSVEPVTKPDASAARWTAVFEAIADRDGPRASRLARETLYAYYADLVRDVGGRLPPG